jgi:hypothetical protein|tara:strand:+ start:427 stop:618 length:192 start_codon:yes stop_codon:yes gene_type:complete
MSAITLKTQSQMKRTGLYLSAELHEEFDVWAEENGVSFNQAAIYFMRLGREALKASEENKLGA